MSATARWLRRAAADEQRRVSLEAALIGGQFPRYAWYRLRYVLASRGLGMVVHVIEFALLSHVFASTHFAAALAVQNACALVAAFWWGALELHRNRIRDGGGKAFVCHETGLWMGRAALMSAVAVAVATGAVGWRSLSRGGFQVVDAYVLVVCVRLAVDLVARAYYSGVYARRRVYRPLPAIMFSEVVSLLAVLATWPLIGAWSLPVALASSVVVSRGLLVHYTGRAYDLIRTQRPRPRVRRALRFRRVRLDAGVVVWAGIANASTRVGSALVLVLLLQDAGVASGLAVVLHLLAPLLATAASWAQVFYLDFRRLEDELTAALRRRLAGRLVPLALALGVSLWCVGVAIVVWQVGGQAIAATLFLFPVFAATGALGQLQLRYFAEQQYRRVAAGSLALAAALVVGLGVAEISQARPLVSRPLAIAGAMVIAIIVITRLRGRAASPRDFGAKQSLVGWLAAVAARVGHVRIVGADLAAARHDQARWISDWIATELGQSGAVYLTPSRRVLWCERSDGVRVDVSTLAVITGGLASAPAEVFGETAQMAIARATECGLIPEVGPVHEAGVDMLVSDFRNRFTHGLVENVCTPRDQGELAGLCGTAQRALWIEALADARGARGTKRNSGFDVTSYVAGGELAIVFAVPRDVDGQERRAWRERLRSANRADAIATPGATRTVGS